MYSPVHASAGLLIAHAIPNPALGLLAALASHYALDAIPHGDLHLGPWMVEKPGMHRMSTVLGLDLGSAALMIAYLVAVHPDRSAIYLIAGAIAGILPDMLWGLRFMVDKLKRPIPLLSNFLHHHDRWHTWGHAKLSYDVPFRIGLIYQGAVLAAIILLRL